MFRVLTRNVFFKRASDQHFCYYKIENKSAFLKIQKVLYSAVDEKDREEVTIKPKDVYVPIDRVEFNFARCSGPGGQNVNKLNTKAELRFNVHEADWIAPDIRQRLLEAQSNKISREGELYISCQEHRTQNKNKEICIYKLKEMIAEATPEPKERVQREGLSEVTKTRRKDEKRHRSAVKANRRPEKGDW